MRKDSTLVKKLSTPAESTIVGMDIYSTVVTATREGKKDKKHAKKT